MTLEQMQKQGRAKMNRPAHGICFEQEDILDQHTANVWKAAQESAYNEIEAVFIKHVPPHAFNLEDGVWIKRLLNKAFKHNEHE